MQCESKGGNSMHISDLGDRLVLIVLESGERIQMGWIQIERQYGQPINSFEDAKRTLLSSFRDDKPYTVD